MKKLCLYTLALLSLFFSLFAVFFLAKEENSPYEYLCKNMPREFSQWVPDTLISEEALDENTWAVFYCDRSGDASCAIVEKTWFSYDLIRHAAMEPIAMGFRCQQIQTVTGYEYLLWGFAEDDAKEIFADGNSCKIMDAPCLNTRIFWIYGDFMNEPSKGPEFEIVR